MDKKKLYRVTEGKKIAGVCGGIAEYFKINANIIRLLWVFFTIFGAWGLLAYIICALVIPLKPSTNN